MTLDELVSYQEDQYDKLRGRGSGRENCLSHPGRMEATTMPASSGDEDCDEVARLLGGSGATNRRHGRGVWRPAGAFGAKAW